MPELLVTDTHALLWHVVGPRTRLGRNARRAFERAEAGRAVVIVPVVVLVELLDGVARGRLSLDGGFAAWTARLRAHPGYDLADLSADIVVRSSELLSIPDRADRLIAATAAHLECPLVTRDPEIAKSAGVEVVW